MTRWRAVLGAVAVGALSLLAGLATVEFPLGLGAVAAVFAGFLFVWLPAAVAVVSADVKSLIPDLPGGILISDVALGLLIAVWISRSLLGATLRRRPPWTRWLVAFVCWAWLSLIAVGSWQTGSALLRVSLYVFAFLVCASDDRFLKPLLVVTTLVAAAQACIGLLGSGFPTDGLVGYVGDSHQFGLMMMAGILGAQSVSWRSLRVVLTLLLALAMALTLRRGIWIAGSVQLAVLYHPSISRARWRLVITGGLIVATLLWVQTTVSTTLDLDPGSLQIRETSWSEALTLFSRNPIFGQGWALGNAAGVLPTYNLWLNVAASTGILGLAFLGLYLGNLVNWLIRLSDPMARFVLAYVAAFLTLSLGEMTVWAGNPGTISFFCLTGAAVGFLSQEKRASIPRPLQAQITLVRSSEPESRR